MKPRHLMILGISSGVLTAVMIYFCAWIVGIALFIFVWCCLEGASIRKTVSMLISYIFLTVSTFILMMIPAGAGAPYFFTWLDEIAFHKGIYGTGDKGITSLSLMIRNFRELSFMSPVIFIVSFTIVLGFIVLFVVKIKYVKEKPAIWSLGWGLLAAMVMVLLFVLKHPGERYLLPLTAILPVFLLLFLKLLEDMLRVRNILVAAIVAFVFIRLPFSFTAFFDTQYNSVKEINDDLKLEKKIIYDYEELVYRHSKRAFVMWTYGTYSPCSGLQFGNDYAGFEFKPELSVVCSRQYEYNVWMKSAFIKGHKKSLRELDWDMIITSKNILDSYGFLMNHGVVKKYSDDVVVIYNPQKHYLK